MVNTPPPKTNMESITTDIFGLRNFVFVFWDG